MFSPFAFIGNATTGSQIPSGIVTNNLAFYLDAANGNFEDTIGGQTGSEVGTINIIDTNYYSGFGVSDYLSFSTDTFNDPSQSVTFETWGYYPSEFTGSGIETLIGINRFVEANTLPDDYIFSACDVSTSASIYTLVPYLYSSPTTFEKIEFSTSASITGSWVQVVTTIDNTTVTTYITPIGSSIISGSESQLPGTTGGFRPFGGEMRIGMCPSGSSGFATAFNNGYVGLVRIYNKALSLNEIKQNYNATYTRF